MLSRLREILIKSSKSSIRMVYSLAPPESVRGMKELNRDEFSIDVEIPTMTLNSPGNEIVSIVKRYLLKLRNFKSLIKHEKDFTFYLDPEKVEKFDDIDEKDRKILSNWTTEVSKSKLKIKYENWKAEHIFSAVLPNDIELPTSFTRMGHIIHLNLRDNQLPFKNLIGQVYLDLVPNIKTVVNKTSNIDTIYRHFSMEIIAGENNTVTTVNENNCSLTFDLAKVYWNSRLCTEHTVLLNLMNNGDVLYDVFAGIGPFSIPASRKGLTVLANDLNPESFRWLKSNASVNKAKAIKCFNKDGRDFLREDVKSHILLRRNEKLYGREHIVMNLPATAYEFLDVFQDWMDEDEIKKLCKFPPLIHFYCFIKGNKNYDYKAAAKTLVESKLNNLSSNSLKVIHHVRNVAPNKEMMRVSFYLTEDLISKEEPMKKRLKTDECDNKIDDLSGKNGEKQQDEKCL